MSGWFIKIAIYLAVIAFVVIEGGAVLLNRAAADDIASSAANEATFSLTESGQSGAAEELARTYTEAKEAELTSFIVNPRAKTVTLTVRRKAKTILVHKVEFLRDFTVAEVTKTKTYGN